LQSELVTERDSKNKLSELNVILTARENEIEILKRDRQSLMHEEQRLLSLFSQLSDERLVETDHVKNLKLSIDHYRVRYQDIEMLTDAAEREVDKLLEAQGKVEEQIRTELSSESITMGLGVERLEGDIARISIQREEFQEELMKQKDAETALKKERHDVISLAEERKVR
jgi:hypothetical protein